MIIQMINVTRILPKTLAVIAAVLTDDDDDDDGVVVLGSIERTRLWTLEMTSITSYLDMQFQQILHDRHTDYLYNRLDVLLCIYHSWW